MMFLVYGKDNCQYCVNAKMLLENRGKPYNYSNLGEDYQLENLKSFIESVAQVTPKTFPQVVYMEENTVHYIGGFEELRSFLNK